MLTILANPILPIFAILGVGFLLQRFRVFDVDGARAINKFVFFVATPALLFSIFARMSFDSLVPINLLIYFLAECFVYFSVAFIAYRFFRCDARESILLGMAACFVNHVFFVLPIAERIHGSDVTQLIAGIILIDALIFCATTVLMDVIGTSKHAAHSFKDTIYKLAKNPFLLACALGVLMWLVPSMIPNGVITYANFVGGAAAPASLFALGVVLASKPIMPIGSMAWVVILSKIIFHPMLFFLLAGAASLSSYASDISLLVAAGPCGAMPFVIALQYGVKPDVITKAILLSTVFSLVTLAILTA